MRVYVLFIICLVSITKARAQAFLGMYATDNSITQIKDNPVFTIHDDIAQYNILGIGFEAGGNSVLFRKKAMGYLFNGKAELNDEYVRNNNSGKEKFFWGNFEIQGPGASFIVKKRFYFSVTTNSRYMVNSDNLNSSVADLLGVNGVKDTARYKPYTIDKYSITAHAFSELNLSYAGFFLESELHTIQGGFSVKLLSGAGAAGMGISTAAFNTSGGDGNAYNVRAIANVAFSPYANEWAITANPFNPFRHPINNLGVGFSAGAAYYYNPREGMVPQKGYKARIAMSITDVGSISYDAASTSGSYRIIDSAINYKKITNDASTTFGNRIFNDYIIKGTATPLSGSKRFKVGLPTALHINADYKINDRLFVNGNMLINLRAPSPDAYATHYISTLTISPRFRFGKVNLSIPTCLNFYLQGYMGAVAEVGAFYVGSTSVLRFATSNNINNLNIYMGTNLRIKPRKQKTRDQMLM